MGKLQFEGLEFYAYHGVMAEEQRIGGNYRIDLEIELDFSDALNTDDIAQSLDYSLIYLLLKNEMEIKSKLIEHVAGRIVSRLLKDFWQISHVKLRLTKLQPPLEGRVPAVSVLIEQKRQN